MIRVLKGRLGRSGPQGLTVLMELRVHKDLRVSQVRQVHKGRRGRLDPSVKQVLRVHKD